MADSRSTSRPRYSEQETALILKRAAELQEGAEGAGTQLSLTEIQEIASEAGIGPAFVTEAATELRHPAPRVGWLGAPTRFHDERSVVGALSTSSVGEIVDCIRAQTRLHGEVKQVLDIIEWRAQAPLGTTIVTLAPREGGTRVAVTTMRADHAALVIMGSVGLGLLVALAIVPVALSTDYDPVGVSAIVAASGVATTLVSARLFWRGVARRWRDRTREIVAAIAERASQLADRVEAATHPIGATSEPPSQRV